MSHFEFNGGQLWSFCSGPPDCYGSCQFLSTVVACPATVSSNISPLDAEMSNGLDTSFIYGQTDDAPCSIREFTSGIEHAEHFLATDDLLFWDVMDYSLCQESWLELPPLIKDFEDPADNNLIPDADQPTYGAIVNLFNPETNLAAPLAVTRSASVRCRWPNFVWLICACNRLSSAAAASLRAKVPQARNVLKGVMKKKDKYVCEMRIMMKMQKEKKKLIRKVWLGTYKTEAQAARALDVGKYFFNSKEVKSFADPNSETILSKLSYLLAQPLDELVENVKKLAKDYGENGSVQNFAL